METNQMAINDSIMDNKLYNIHIMEYDTGRELRGTRGMKLSDAVLRGGSQNPLISKAGKNKLCARR